MDSSAHATRLMRLGLVAWFALLPPVVYVFNRLAVVWVVTMTMVVVTHQQRARTLKASMIERLPDLAKEYDLAAFPRWAAGKWDFSQAMQDERVLADPVLSDQAAFVQALFWGPATGLVLGAVLLAGGWAISRAL